MFFITFASLNGRPKKSTIHFIFWYISFCGLYIQAGNQYFPLKKNKYAESEIATVQSLSKYPKSDWVKEDIEKREKDVINKLITFFESELTKK